MKEKNDLIKDFLKLIILSTNYINEDPKLAASDASKWIKSIGTICPDFYGERG